MSISAVITTVGSQATSFPVVGNSELNALWKPIIERNGLHYLNYVATAGLRIDAENRADVLAEIQVLRKELESVREYENDIANPVFRCRRLLDIVTNHNPEDTMELYIG